MPTDKLLEILLQTNELLKRTESLKDEDIVKEALDYFKKNKREILKFFLKNDKAKKHLILTAGASGVGKSEFVQSLNYEYSYNIADIDEIRKIFPFYTGKNASLFQKPAIKAIEYLVDNFFKHNYAFIIDSNLASFNVAKKNIERALKREYKIDIYFLYRDYQKCQEYTQIREEKEGRKVNDNVFNNKAKNSLLTIKEIILNYYDNENVSIFINDIDEHKIYCNKDEMLQKIEEYQTNLDNFLNKLIEKIPALKNTTLYNEFLNKVGKEEPEDYNEAIKWVENNPYDDEKFMEYIKENYSSEEIKEVVKEQQAKEQSNNQQITNGSRPKP